MKCVALTLKVILKLLFYIKFSCVHICIEYKKVTSEPVGNSGHFGCVFLKIQWDLVYLQFASSYWIAIKFSRVEKVCGHFRTCFLLSTFYTKWQIIGCFCPENGMSAGCHFVCDKLFIFRQLLSTILLKPSSVNFCISIVLN